MRSPCALQQRLDARQVDVALERMDQGRLQALRGSPGRRPRRRGTPGWRGWCRSGSCWAPAAPFLQTAVNSTFSAARPWCVGTKCCMPVMSWMTASQAEEAARAGVALVALHDGAPLARRHGAGAGIGEPVDEHVLGAELEDVQLARPQQPLALGAGGHADGFDALDAEGFDQWSWAWRPRVRIAKTSTAGAIVVSGGGNARVFLDDVRRVMREERARSQTVCVLG